MKRIAVFWLMILVLYGLTNVIGRAFEPPLTTTLRFLEPQSTLKPTPEVTQGDILRIRYETSGGLAEGAMVTLAGQKGRLFQQADGHYETLLGIPVDMKTGGHTVQIKTVTGDPIDSRTIQVRDGKFRRQNISVGKSTKGLQPLPGEMEAIQALKENVTAVRYWDKPLVSPTPDCENSPFGVKRYHNGVYIHDYHKGVDLRSPQGRPIRAIADGVVKIAAPQFRLHGGTVGLDHGQGLNSVYIHMSKVAVKQGQPVKKGDTIGYVGSTGFATGPHLHWGLYANGVPVNPDQWIPVPRC